MKCKIQQHEVYHSTDYMSTFGYGHDLNISNDCNINTSSYSNLGSGYEAPNEYTYNSTEAKNYLAGSY